MNAQRRKDMKNIDTSNRARRQVLQGVVISFVLIVTAFAGLPAEGDEITGDGGRYQAPLDLATYAGPWEREVAAEYVGNYPGWKDDLPNAHGNAFGFVNTLRLAGEACTVGRCYVRMNSDAWERDFKRHDLGGKNNNYVDDVDIVFYEGHGNPWGFTFYTPSGPGTHDDEFLHYTDARMAWGDKDAEYIALMSCSVLAQSHVSDWRQTMNGLHLLLGFKTTAYDTRGFGARFARNILSHNRIRTAWFRACDTHQPSGVMASVLAEDMLNLRDTWYYRYHLPRDANWVLTTHSCGSVSPLVSANLVTAAEPGKVTEVMPVFATPALSLDEQRAEWASLTDAFEVPTRAVRVSGLSATGTYSTSIVDGRELEMDQANGLFYYIDHNLLYTMTTPSRVQTISAASAKDIADQFLADKGLMPGDALFTTVMTEGATELETVTTTGGLQSSTTRVLAETVTDYQVFYSRVLTYTTETIQDGKVVQQVETVPVVGPGSKLKVYVSAGGGAARVASAGAEGAVVGAMGGWRGIDDKAGQRAIQSTVPILPYAMIEQLFRQLEPQVALEHVPFNNPTQKEILQYTLGYWEEPTGAGQAELYPAYILNARYEGEAGPGITQTVVVTDYTYLPANEEYMRPLARIDAHSDLSVTYAPGEVITATAADASLTLAQLGYHSSLTFTLGAGGDYLYDWYLGSVEDDNHIGSGRNLAHTITIPSDASHAVPVPQTVILVVTDSDSAHSAQDTSTTSIEVNVMAPVFLPLVLRN
jgi:hypothetical protein